MAVYNGEKYIGEAIQSVLNQTMSDFEFIIVNDGSKDRTEEIIRSYKDGRIKIINNEKNLGLIGSLNRGLEIASGKYIARLDHDDIAQPERFAIQYQFMEDHPHIDVVGSWTECIDSDGKYIKISRNPTEPIAIKYEFIFNNVMLHSSIFFRTQKIRSNGGYSKEYIHSEDFEMYTRPYKELVCANIPKVLFKLRIHNSSITGSGETQPTVYSNAINIVYRNITKYIEISRKDFDDIVKIMIVKKPDRETSLKNLLKALSVLKNITLSFINKNNLNNEDKMIVFKHYKGRRRMMIQHYLIGRYRSIFHG